MDPCHAELKRAGSLSRGGVGTAGAEEQEQGDFLAIEDLLDFSNEDIAGSIESFDSHDCAPASSIVLSCRDEPERSSVSSAAADRFIPKQQHQELNLLKGDVGGSGELCVPCDDISELEWLSNFVEESFSSADGALLEGMLLHEDDEKASAARVCESKLGPRASPTSVLDPRMRTGTHRSTSRTGHGCHLHVSPDQIYLSRPAGRARSKRCRRTAVCFWNTRILSITDDCNFLEASTSTLKLTSQQQQPSSSSSESEDAIASLGYDNSDDFFQSARRKSPYNIASSKFSKGVSCTGRSKGSTNAARAAKARQQLAVSGDRRCLHCGSQRTPQWRAGPMGPKTLCNACGVRYKSGRLLPEYRPAASPTFVETIHSNSHRRVLEMRQQRGDRKITLSPAQTHTAIFSL